MARLFESKLAQLILLLFIPLLFLPKINLIQFDQNETAGLRIDDILLFGLGLLLLIAHAHSHQKLYRLEGWILLLTGFSLLSFLANRFLVSAHLLFMDAKIFYPIRLLEYFLFFYIGTLAFPLLPSSKLIRLFFLWNFILMILQKFNLLGAITVGGYHADVSSRVQGIASFPSEMGLLLNLLFCYLLYDLPPSRFISRFSSSFARSFLIKLYPYALFCLFGILIVFTGNRISILALLICFLFKIKNEFQWRSLGSLTLFIFITPFLLLGIGLVMTQTASVYQRSADLFSFKNLELAGIVWEGIDLTQNPLGNEIISSENYDVSWWLRIHKWVFVLKAYLSNPLCYLQGLGPGFAGSALDGGLLRIFTEYGLIGTWLFWQLFASLYQINRQTKWMTIAFLINMLFFDAYLAYKTMSVLFFVCGEAFSREQALKNSQKESLKIRGVQDKIPHYPFMD